MWSDENRCSGTNMPVHVTEIALVILLLVSSCSDNPYNDLNYYYCNFGQFDAGQMQTDYSFLVNMPAKITDRRTFTAADISCDTTGEITGSAMREKLSGNILLNGFYYYKSTARLLNAGDVKPHREADLHDYLSRRDESSYRYFMYGVINMSPSVRSFLISENYKDRYCELWLINTDPGGRIISASILSKYQEVNGSLFATEKINTTIRSGKVLIINYETSAFPSDISNKDLKPYRHRTRLKIRMEDNGELSVR